MGLHQGFYGVLIPTVCLTVAARWNATAYQLLKWQLTLWAVQYAFFFFRPYERKTRIMGHVGWGDDSVFGSYMLRNVPTRVLFQDREVYTSKKVPSQYVMALHPHGVWSIGHLHVAQGSHGVNKIFDPRKRRSLSARALFLVPVFRELWLWNNFVDASRHVAEKCLKEGFSLTVLPGGEREQLLSQPGKDLILLKNRKGFVRLALKRGIPLIPIYAFGENDLSENPPWLFNFRSWVQRKFAIALIFAHSFDVVSCCGRRWRIPRPGRAYYHSRPLVIAYGKPVYPPTRTAASSPATDVSQPEAEVEWRSVSEEEVDQFHEAYMEALQNLFEEMKDRAGFPLRTLEII